MTRSERAAIEKIAEAVEALAEVASVARREMALYHIAPINYRG
jgi:hypothetical protein